MLRHLRRDRFAPHLPLEREHREAAFAEPEKIDSAPTANASNQTVEDTGAAIRSQIAGNLTPRNIENILQVPHALRAFLNVSPNRSEERRLRELCTRLQIPETSNSAQADLEIWLKQQDDESDNGPNLIRSAIEDPELELLLIRGLQQQAEQYKQGIEYIKGVEDWSSKGHSTQWADAATDSKRQAAAHGLSRYDVYAKIMGHTSAQSLLQIPGHDGQGIDAVRSWIDQASPEDLARMGIPMTNKGDLTKRIAGMLKQAGKTLGVGSWFWGGSTQTGSVEEEQLQMDFFAEVSKQIVTLKRHLAERIRNDAGTLNEAIRLRTGAMCSELGITKETTQESHPEVWQRFQSVYGANFTLFLSELGGAQSELQRTCEGIGPGISASYQPIQDALEYLRDMRGKDLWEVALKRAKARTESNRTWTQGFLQHIAQIRPALADAAQRRNMRERLGADGEQTLQQIEHLAAALQDPASIQPDPAALEDVQRSLTPVLLLLQNNLRSDSGAPQENAAADIATVEQQFAQILPKIRACAACAHLGVDSALTKAIRQCRQQENADTPEAEKQRELLQRAANLIENIHVERIPSDEPRKGYVRFREKCIVINPKQCRDAAEERIVEDHEYGHLVLHILTEETGLLLSDFDARLDRASTIVTTSGRTLEALLAALAMQWGFPQRREAIAAYAQEQHTDAEALYDRKVLEEAYCRYGTYRKKLQEQENYDLDTDRQFTENERELLRTLDRTDAGQREAAIAPAIAAMDLESNLDADQVLGEEIVETSKDKRISVPDMLNTAERSTEEIQRFLKAFPEQGVWLNQPLQEIIRFSDKTKEMYSTRKRDGEEFDPDNDLGFQAMLKHANDKIENEILKKIHEFDRAGYDLTKEPNGRRNWWQFLTRDIQWLSIMDYVQMAKEASEDIQRLWKRRGENARAKVGGMLTQWISNKVPYLGQLQYEFNRRSQSSEIDAVSVWEKALENVDPYSLQESLSEIMNQDHLKATLIRLTRLGRLDWNDLELWRALGRLSHFQIPEEQCLRDQQLRDFWLKKCIEDIWTDKSLYYDWKQANDSGVDSGKHKFTTTADDLSNISGGLANRMEMQLKMYTEARTSGTPIPNDVNPHIYEECLHYAIRNGKCTMEQKLYYLVRGVASGLLSLDRLRYIAGEGGKILNVFPFIDYFYGHNNSMGEIKILEKRLTETKSGMEFRPGPKTTLWFNLEVLRDSSVRIRISKAISGERAQNIDHEDYPGLMSQADYTQIEELTGAISGTRQKQSYEAMKNAYLGFTMRFKTLGRIASLHDRGERFGPTEVQEAARAILAYVHYDNIMTRNGWDGKERGKLEWNKYDEECPSSGGKTVHEVRDTANTFIVEIFNALESRGVRFNWPDGVTKDMYLHMMSGKHIVDDKVAQQKVFTTTRHIAAQMENALMQHQDVLRSALASRADQMISDNVQEFSAEETSAFLREQRE